MKDTRYKISAPFTAAEIDALASVARILNAAAPKMSDAVRYLTAIGWQHFVAGERPIQPAIELPEEQEEQMKENANE